MKSSAFSESVNTKLPYFNIELKIILNIIMGVYNIVNI